ncbi:aminotransferase class I/II-fold pyridoxal phosphate-dependent enzyme [Rhodoferax bucti]|uniref:aminotransferase class I/II-fold pyridoxal phosphate-dependent enzyme n=1 Tax=Rhodoferax bucti TaxID=2576305 RepID=UPI0011097572|nr:aminotransferase class I/II-fold pyridoxal phosphate-dependent enzyme [Rhodoferax bucti]
MNAVTRIHGGPDAAGAARFDFSTNSNACGPCPMALAAVQAADATRYPDPQYTALKVPLAAHHAVEPWRVVLAGSASEFIFRISAWVRQAGGSRVHLPQHAYGDYAHAAQAWGLVQMGDVDAADLVWACDPASPTGQNHTGWLRALERSTVVLDGAYAPLRLSGEPALTAPQRDAVWQLFSPNKALGLTGVRAAYAIAPLHAQAAATALDAMAPSWVLGAHGVAMLHSWAAPETQGWVTQSLDTLRAWKVYQIKALEQAGWTVMPGHANFFCARPPKHHDLQSLLATLRARGIKLRDTTSFGLPGWARLGVLPPGAVDALMAALAA